MTSDVGGARPAGRALAWSIGPDGLAEVVLDRAPLNELGEDALAELEGLLDALEAGAAAPEEGPGGGARGVLLTSARPRGFCAGADLRALAAAIAARGHAAVTAEVTAFIGRIGRAFARLDRWPGPTCAAVHGPCFGGGLELALCCDLRVADRTARFALPELRLGLVPGFGGLARLGRDLGQGLVRDLLLTGRSLGAERALAVGLVGQVTGPGEHVAVARRALAQAARQDPAAYAAAKALLKPPQDAALAAEAAAFCRLFARPAVARALEAFAARRDAQPYLPGA